MKNTDLISIAVKFLGLVAIWRAVLGISAVITGIALLTSSISVSSQMNTSYVQIVAFSMILNFVLPSVLAFFSLFRTEKVLSLLNIKDESVINLSVNKLVIYHVLILVFGMMMLLHGSDNFLEVQYHIATNKTYTTTTVLTGSQSPDNSPREETLVTDTKDFMVNYLALAEIIVGIVILVHAVGIARIVERNFDSKTISPTEGTSN
jgi:hypothetical protein